MIDALQAIVPMQCIRVVPIIHAHSFLNLITKPKHKKHDPVKEESIVLSFRKPEDMDVGNIA